MKTFCLTFLFAFILCLNSIAYAFEVDGIRYNIISEAERNVEVTSGGSYEGDISIPQTVEHDGIPYNVTTIGSYAFNECGLTSIDLPEGIETISSSAFSWCSSLTSITIPSSVTTIGDYAFSVSGIESITIPSTVTAMGEAVFWHCEHLREITLHENNTFSTNVFAGLINLKDVYFIVTDWAAFCRKNTTGLFGRYNVENDESTIQEENANIHLLDMNGTEMKNFVVPEGVTYIGDRAFLYCNMLESITLPADMRIGEDCFGETETTMYVVVKDYAAFCGGNVTTALDPYPCIVKLIDTYDNEITDFVIPEGVKTIAQGAFINCYGVRSVTIPSSVESVATEAFIYNDGIKTITMPAALTNFAEYSFNLPSLELINLVVDDMPAFCQDNALQHITIGSAACKLIDNADNEITEFTIPEGVTNILPNAFYHCSGLQNITIPSSVTHIGSSAFNGCTSLTSITIPSSITSIDGTLFEGCSGLTSITIPASLTITASNAFASCGNLKEFNLVVEDNATFCESNALTHLPNKDGMTIHLLDAADNEITNFTVPAGVTSIKNKTFINCNGLKSVSIPSSVLTIAANAFQGCYGLKKVNIDSNKILSQSFASSSENIGSLFGKQVEEYIIGNHVTDIGTSAFEDLPNIQRITLSDCLTTIWNYAFAGCSGLASIDIPEGVTMIYNYSFSNCSALTSITIPTTVTSIGNYVFSGCLGLENVVIPSTVTYIGKSAFDNCPNLINVHCQIEKPLQLSNAETFSNRTNATLFVPSAPKKPIKSPMFGKISTAS